MANNSKIGITSIREDESEVDEESQMDGVLNLPNIDIRSEDVSSPLEHFQSTKSLQNPTKEVILDNSGYYNEVFTL
jgi:hypothetical protein